MFRGMFDWLFTDHSEPNYTVRKREVEELPKPIPTYEYWPQFDDDEPTLEMAYKFYEENSVCHLCQNQKVRCYLEYPERYYDIKENRLTRI